LPGEAWDDSAGTAPLAAVEGVSFASAVASAGACAVVSFALALAAFGLPALACFGLAAAGFDFAPSAFALPASATAAVVLVGSLAFAEDLAADGFAAAFAVEDLAVAGLAADVLAVAADDLDVDGFARAADGFAVDGFAVDDFAVDDFAVDDFAVVVDGLAAFARTVRADVAARAAVVLAPPVVLERAELAGEGIAADIALAASVSDLTAVSIDLVAALIACSAVVIVLADVVAFVAAVFSFAAADVTLVAAVETDRAFVAVLAVRLAVAVRAVLLLAAPAFADVRLAVPLAAGLAAARVVFFFAVLAAGDLAELVRLALAVRGRAGFVAAGDVGTDLPPSGSVTGSLIPRRIKFYTSSLLTQEPQKALAPQYIPLAYASGTTIVSLGCSLRRRRVRVGQQPADGCDRLLRRRAAPDRDTDEIAGQRDGEPHHVVRDLPGHVKQLALNRVSQHVILDDIQRRRDLREPLLHVRHRSLPSRSEKPTADLLRLAAAHHAEVADDGRIAGEHRAREMVGTGRFELPIS
jgi:hypothetical protein